MTRSRDAERAQRGSGMSVCVRWLPLHHVRCHICLVKKLYCHRSETRRGQITPNVSSNLSISVCFSASQISNLSSVRLSYFLFVSPLFRLSFSLPCNFQYAYKTIGIALSGLVEFEVVVRMFSTFHQRSTRFCSLCFARVTVCSSYDVRRGMTPV